MYTNIHRCLTLVLLRFFYMNIVATSEAIKEMSFKSVRFIILYVIKGDV